MMSQFTYLLQKENLANLAVLPFGIGLHFKLGYIQIDRTVFNWGNLLNWLYHGSNLYENLQNLAALLISVVVVILNYYYCQWLH